MHPRSELKVNRAQAITLAASSLAISALSTAPAAANIPVSGGIYSLWITNPARFGQPVAAEQALSPVSAYQSFSNGIIIWDASSGSHFYPGNPNNFVRTGSGNMLRDANIRLTSSDALIIGDSQVGEPNTNHSYWVGQGFTQAGYRPYFYSWGGIGVYAANQYHPSYVDSVINNARALPLGSPGIVYIQGSGNDLWTGRSYQDTAEGMRAVIRKLRELYPTSLIMLSEVVGRRIPEQTNRHQLSEHLAAMGRQENVNVVPTRYWITDKGVAHLLADSVHLSPTGHTAFAPHLAAWIRWANGTGFADVLPTETFFTQMNWMRTSGISTGWEDGTYRPYQSALRGEIAAFFYRLAGSPTFTPPAVSPFHDVPTTHAFYHHITWMQAAGITTGWADGTFRPQQPVLRAEIAAFFYRFNGSPVANLSAIFKDVPVTHPFNKQIAWMHANGITTGWSDGTFRPQQPVLRAEIAAFTYRTTHRS